MTVTKFLIFTMPILLFIFMDYNKIPKKKSRQTNNKVKIKCIWQSKNFF